MTGPLITTWCMRMEGENSYFKRIAQISNFKNVPYTVAKRHQRLLCAYLQDDSLIQTLSVVQVFVVSYNTVCGQLLYVYLFTASHPKQLCAEDEDIITKVNEITGDSSSSPTALVHR